ncbi:MAG: hypothetical protein KI792_08085 [Alphaproteobacteria bacterium]|nr:hypothetical protein [Alphaproteobacteria bacterium SS10]
MKTYQFAHWLKGLMMGAGSELNRAQVDEIAKTLAHVDPDPDEPEEAKAKAWLEKRIKAIVDAPNEEREALLCKRLHRDLANDFAKHEAANDD